jgi:hypothetical protein
MICKPWKPAHSCHAYNYMRSRMFLFLARGARADERRCHRGWLWPRVGTNDLIEDLRFGVANDARSCKTNRTLWMVTILTGKVGLSGHKGHGRQPRSAHVEFPTGIPTPLVMTAHTIVRIPCSWFGNHDLHVCRFHCLKQYVGRRNSFEIIFMVWNHGFVLTLWYEYNFFTCFPGLKPWTIKRMVTRTCQSFMVCNNTFSKALVWITKTWF